MNYTEEQYSELYNNLPKGLRDLVLTGNLTTAVGAIAMKYGLTPEETSELEPAVEDVALGLITPEELAENIFIQVGLDDAKAQAIAGEAMRNIYGEYLEELRLTRKYKIELDTRIRKEEEAKNPSLETEEVDVGGEKSKVAGNIINITRDSNNSSKDITENDTDKKVADWFSGKKTSTRAELDALGDDTTTPRVVPIQKNIPTTELRKPLNTEPKNLDLEKTVAPVTNTPKSAWEEVTSAKTNNLKPQSQPVVSPSKVVVGQSGNKDLEKSMVQVEQQILTLTQAVNKMIDQNSKTINPVVQSVFNSGQYEEVSRRMDAMNHRIDDLQAKLINLVDQHKKDVSHIIDDRLIDIGSKNTGDSTTNRNSTIDNLIKNKQETETETVNKQTLNSTISKGVLDGIFQTKKIDIVNKSETSEKNEKVDTKSPETDNKNPSSRSSARDQLLKDIESLKKNLQTKQGSVVTTETQSAADNLKEEISPSTETEKMKNLQDKIKSLNKGITQGGIVSNGSQNIDPYRQ